MELMNNGFEGLGGGDSMMQTKTRIHRFSHSHRLSGVGGPDNRMHMFPHHLRGLGGPDGRYVVPSVVAIGPYHHGKPHLQAMEEVKQAAVQKFCLGLAGLSVDDVYAKILSIASHARSCYTTTSIATPTLLQSLQSKDNDFAEMMLRDGCFLLCFMYHRGRGFLTGCTLSSGPSILKDMFLLENQIPMLVLAALMEFLPEDMRKHIAQFVETFWPCLIETTETTKVVPLWIMRFLKCGRTPEEKMDTDESSIGHGDPKLPAPHLLSLLRFAMIRRMPPQKRESSLKPPSSSSLMISAVALAEKGIKLAVNTTKLFAADMSVQKKPFSCELSLSPLFLNDVNACWLVNLVALEAIEATTASRINKDGYVVSSYLSLLAMLLNKEEDVHKLQRRSVLSTNFSNADTLAFFKGLSKHLRLGYNYFNTLNGIEDYMRQRALWVAVHKFFYNHGDKLKVAAAVLSAISVLVGIFRAFYPAKQS
ncbi:UPF0481 protein At3g47200-like [Panicum virgatum]|nr:UPF0481 protein At3g47200-like [Panicum virgatum]